MSIDITNIDRDLLLEELWKKSKIIVKFAPFNLKIAKQQMTNSYPDYICGRAIKLEIYNSNMIDPYLYDRDNGDGAVYNIVNNIKKTIHTKIQFNIKKINLREQEK